MTVFRAALAAALLAIPTAHAAMPTPQALAPGVFLIPGGFEPGRQPDGNTVVFDAPQGLVVFDTGRHAWQRQAIEARAKAAGKPVAAIVNSHWHLDHVSGNLGLKAAFPKVRVYASGAIDGALKGFLANSAVQAREALASGKLDTLTVEEINGDLSTFDRGAELRPDVVVSRSGPVQIAGRRFDLRLAANAATEGDVWLYDAKSRIAVAGDLVTLPVPFLDTACPDGWRKALARVDATPFLSLVPGHGAPMTRVQFATYRRAFDGFVDCARSDRAADACADGWMTAAAALLPADEAQRKRTRGMARYYVEQVLRANGGKSKSCPA